MTAPLKPWERQKNQLNSSAAPEDIITPSTSDAVTPTVSMGGTSQLVVPGLDQSLTNPSTTSVVTSGETGDASTAATTTSTTNGLSSSLGSGYGGYGSRGMYGGGMYGGMGMGGYGMGGMYGGMGMGGMYGANMNDPNASFFQKMQMYIYQLCEIAQMVEFHAHGLAGFFTTLKNISILAATTGKDWVIKIIKKSIEVLKNAKQKAVTMFRRFFIDQDLSKEELEKQISILQVVIKTVIVFVAINCLRLFVRLIRKRMRQRYNHF